MRPEKPQPPIVLRVPVAEDARALHELIANSPPLDPNSLYCNLLHCTHFSATSVAALIDAETNASSDRRAAAQSAPLLGFISAYIPPAQPDTLFVWQVVVAAGARGQGLAQRMLDSILQRPACAAVRYLDTTITPANQASWALFRAWARRRQAALAESLHFERERHFGGLHDSEHLVRIGPFALAAEAAT